MKTLILNDIHLNCRRAGGTTKQSRKDLEVWMLGRFKGLLEIPHEKLIILGDLYDRRHVDEHIMKDVIELLDKENCAIAVGNHDVGKGEDGNTISSCEFTSLMSDSTLIKAPIFSGGLYIIPHVSDQKLFDHAVQLCPDNTIMLTHANIDSPFAHGDHSLNLSLQQMKDLTDRGVDVIAGHEHTRRDVMNVSILGNQFPSSIADCLGGDKFAHVLEDGVLTSIPTWTTDSYYEGSEIPKGHYDFINITGECELVEYPAVVKAVAELRKNSDAFIVKNSTKVKEFEVAKMTEEITRFNIVDMLLEEINPDYRDEVRSCI